jgi:hypothetical protein
MNPESDAFRWTRQTSGGLKKIVAFLPFSRVKIDRKNAILQVVNYQWFAISPVSAPGNMVSFCAYRCHNDRKLNESILSRRLKVISVPGPGTA